jgi:hypothetical protein
MFHWGGWGMKNLRDKVVQPIGNQESRRAHFPEFLGKYESFDGSFSGSAAVFKCSLRIKDATEIYINIF